MHRSFKALAFASIVATAASLTSGMAFAQATPTTTTTQHVTATIPFAPPPPPCVGSAGFVDIDFNSVLHMNTLPNGRILVHATTTGSFTAHPFVGLESSGHFTATESDTVVGTTFTQHQVVMIVGRDTSGTLVNFHLVIETTVDLITNTTTVDTVHLRCA